MEIAMIEEILIQIFSPKQILSIIGMALTVFSFQMKTKKQILMMQTAGSAFYLVSYFLLQSWAAVLLNVVFLIRNIVFYFKDKKWASHCIWLYVILLLVVIAGALGYQTWWDLVPIVGSIFGTIAAYMKRENLFRIFKLGDAPCWLIFNISIPSIGGIIGDSINVISITVGLIRYRKDGIFIDKRKGNAES